MVSSGERQGAAVRAHKRLSGQILPFRRLFGLVFLDSGRRAAISPHHPARGFSRRLFLRGIPFLEAREKQSITTEQKAGPGEKSEAGTEHTKDENDVRSHQDRRP